MGSLSQSCYLACYQTGDIEIVKDCIAQGLDINQRFEQIGALPLDASLYGGHMHIFEFLLSKGADPNGVGYDEGTILMAAAYMGLPEYVRLLIEYGADPNKASSITGETPLHVAAAKGFRSSNLECVQLLLDAGADPNIKTKNGIPTPTHYRDITVVGETSLHLAAAYGSQAMIEVLIAYGADKTIKDDRGDSPLTWYSRHQRLEDHLKLGEDSQKLLLYK